MTQYVGLDVADEEWSIRRVPCWSKRKSRVSRGDRGIHSRTGPAGGESRVRDGTARGLALARAQTARAAGGASTKHLYRSGTSSTADHILWLSSGTRPNLRDQASGGGTVSITSSVAIVNDTIWSTIVGTWRP